MRPETVVARIRQANSVSRVHVAANQLRSALRLELERRYRPDQPRVPAGTPGGGRWTDDTATHAENAVHGGRIAGLAEDLQGLGGGVPIMRLTRKGAPQFIFPNGMILRFDLLPGQYLPGQGPHINLELPGTYNHHINLK